LRYHLGASLYQQQKEAESLKEWRKARHIDPIHAKAVPILRQLGDPDPIEWPAGNDDDDDDEESEL
jgi:hypothetical protein